MNFRKFINSNAKFIGILAVIIAAGAFWFSYKSSFGGSGPVYAAKYFTTDDGQTYFPGDALDFAPFMKDGKEAVQAHVFVCKEGAFVGYLERFNKQSRPAMEEVALAAKEKRQPRNLGAIIAANQSGTEIKRPGDKEWISGAGGAKSAEIRAVKCKDGTPALPKKSQ